MSKTMASTARDEELRIERMQRELWLELAALVQGGEMTDMEANEWFNDKCDQWARGLS